MSFVIEFLSVCRFRAIGQLSLWDVELFGFMRTKGEENDTERFQFVDGTWFSLEPRCLALPL
jgi:hypothetical protein